MFIMDNLWQWSEFVSVKIDTKKYMIQFNGNTILKDINVLYLDIRSHNKSMLISYHNAIKIFDIVSLMNTFDTVPES